MSDQWQGQGWWQASDNKWYPPEQHPNYYLAQQSHAMPANPAPLQQFPYGPPDGAASNPRKKKIGLIVAITAVVVAGIVALGLVSAVVSGVNKGLHDQVATSPEPSPSGGSSAPTDGSSAPTDGSSAPTDGSSAPTGQTVTPGDIASDPNGLSNVPLTFSGTIDEVNPDGSVVVGDPMDPGSDVLVELPDGADGSQLNAGDAVTVSGQCEGMEGPNGPTPYAVITATSVTDHTTGYTTNG